MHKQVQSESTLASKFTSSREAMLVHLGRAEVEMHAMVLAGNGADVKVTESADLQLESQRWL